MKVNVPFVKVNVPFIIFLAERVGFEPTNTL